MAVMARKVLKVNGVPFSVNRVVQNIREYPKEFIETVLKNSNSEFRIEDGNGTAFFCSKVETFNFNPDLNKWISETPRNNSVSVSLPAKKHNPRTKRNKKCKR